MTVGMLRRILERYPDNMLVYRCDSHFDVVPLTYAAGPINVDRIPREQDKPTDDYPHKEVLFL